MVRTLVFATENLRQRPFSDALLLPANEENTADTRAAIIDMVPYYWLFWRKMQRQIGIPLNRLRI